MSAAGTLAGNAVAPLRPAARAGRVPVQFRQGDLQVCRVAAAVAGCRPRRAGRRAQPARRRRTPGGGDLDPRLYSEEPSAVCYDVNHPQDGLDMAVARRAVDVGLPLLGICRGHQLLNVLCGGTLVQDMAASAVTHIEPAPADGTRPWAWHDVDVSPRPKVAGLYGAAQAEAISVKIASGHHQAVARVAEGLVVTARAEDGTVEALEDPRRWVRPSNGPPRRWELSAEAQIAPFRAFVEICRNGR